MLYLAANLGVDVEENVIGKPDHAAHLAVFVHIFAGPKIASGVETGLSSFRHRLARDRAAERLLQLKILEGCDANASRWSSSSPAFICDGAAATVNIGRAMEVDDDELGPLLEAPPPYFDLRRLIRSALGFPGEYEPMLIGIDGVDGSGKSAAASWLSWQLGIHAVHLDLYLVPDSEPLGWRDDDLCRVLEAQTALQRPVIVEGVLLLRALRKVRRVPDFLVFVEKNQHKGCGQGRLRDELEAYLSIERPKQQAKFVLKWSDADYLERMMQAHLRERELDR